MSTTTSTSRWHLRRARPADAPAIGAVFDAAVAEAWGFLGERVSRPLFSPAEWDELVADHAPPRAMLVAADARKAVVGFVAVQPDAREVFLLFVAPAWSGRGVGRGLLDEGHAVLAAAGCTEAVLFTEERNARARAVYAAAGYRPDGTVRRSVFHGAALRELRLVRAL